MKNTTLQIVWIVVEVLAIVRSAIATFNVVMNVTNNDTVFSLFTCAVIELALFAMLLMTGTEAVAPVAALVLIAFSGVMQYAEIALITGTMDDQAKQMLRYGVSFAPTVLLLVGLVKRVVEEHVSTTETKEASRALAADVPFGRGKKRGK